MTSPPGLVALDCRVNELAVGTAYDVLLQTTFTDRSAYDAYRVDPVHREVATLVRSLMSHAATIDSTS